MEISQKLEEAIASRQEAEAKLQHAENKIKELEQGSGARSGPVSIYIRNKYNIHFRKLNNPNNVICYARIYRELARVLPRLLFPE